MFLGITKDTFYICRRKKALQVTICSNYYENAKQVLLALELGSL